MDRSARCGCAGPLLRRSRDLHVRELEGFAYALHIETDLAVFVALGRLEALERLVVDEDLHGRVAGLPDRPDRIDRADIRLHAVEFLDRHRLEPALEVTQHADRAI